MATGRDLRSTDADSQRPVTLVWVDAREAFIVRWIDGGPIVERLESDVPTHHRSTGHVRYDPSIRHGGGGGSQAAEEGHRLEHLVRFVEAVADRLPPEDDLLIEGPGTVHERLARLMTERDDGRPARRAITSAVAGPSTKRQLVAQLRLASGHQPRRRGISAAAR